MTVNYLVYLIFYIASVALVIIFYISKVNSRVLELKEMISGNLEDLYSEDAFEEMGMVELREIRTRIDKAMKSIADSYTRSSAPIKQYSGPDTDIADIIKRNDDARDRQNEEIRKTIDLHFGKAPEIKAEEEPAKPTIELKYLGWKHEYGQPISNKAKAAIDFLNENFDSLIQLAQDEVSLQNEKRCTPAYLFITDDRMQGARYKFQIAIKGITEIGISENNNRFITDTYRQM